MLVLRFMPISVRIAFWRLPLAPGRESGLQTVEPTGCAAKGPLSLAAFVVSCARIVPTVVALETVRLHGRVFRTPGGSVKRTEPDPHAILAPNGSTRTSSAWHTAVSYSEIRAQNGPAKEVAYADDPTDLRLTSLWFR
jgi:hypothetical protein